MDSLIRTCSLILQLTALYYDVESKAFCGFRVLALSCADLHSVSRLMKVLVALPIQPVVDI